MQFCSLVAIYMVVVVVSTIISAFSVPEIFCFLHGCSYAQGFSIIALLCTIAG
jgi:hypothetical protein